MNKYKVSFTNRNTLDPRDADTIQHETVTAPDEQTARDMFAVSGCEVVSVELDEADMQTALRNQRTRILATFEQEPISKEDADELYRELMQVDDCLYDYTPTPSGMPVINFDNVEEVKF